MSEDWVITPPNSPVFLSDGNSEQIKSSVALRDEREVCLKHDWSFRSFNCTGEVCGNNQGFDSEGYISCGDHLLFSEDFTAPVVFEERSESFHLFGFKFEKGTALLREADALFKMGRMCIIQLNAEAKLSSRTFGRVVTNKGSVNCKKLRQDVVEFLLYIRNYVQRICFYEKYSWLVEKLLPQLADSLLHMWLTLGRIIDIPDYVINYCANSSGNKCNQPSYHMFHCQLDVRWLILTISYQLAYCNQLRTNNSHSSQMEQHGEKRFTDFEHNVLLLMSDLTWLALRRFNQMQPTDLLQKSAFSCTCVRELWRLLQLSCDILVQKHHCSSFWDCFGKIYCTFTKNEESESEKTDYSSVTLPRCYPCSNRQLFLLWLLKHLATLYVTNNDCNEKVPSNYPLLESVIKSINEDATELHMRIHLTFIWKILDTGWESKAEPVLLLWEYYHKRLNNSFYIAGTPLSSIAIVSKSALGLLAMTNANLTGEKSDQNTDSFHLFLKLLGSSLQRWHYDQRFWNKLKGRVFSKFSESKIKTLNETGLYHFISLFLTLAITADLEEVSNRFRALLEYLPQFESLEKSKAEVVVKGHLAFVILHAERNADITDVSAPLLRIVDDASLRTEFHDLIAIFLEGFQDLIDCTDNLELGQHKYIGSWINNYLLSGNESDMSRLLDTLLNLVNKLNVQLTSNVITSDDNHLLLALWEHLSPFMKRMLSSNNCFLYQVAEIASSLTLSSLNLTPSTNLRKKATELFDFMTTSDTTHVNFLCRYLSHVCNEMDISIILTNRNVALLRSWIKCNIVMETTETNKFELNQITKYIWRLQEMKQLITDPKSMESSEEWKNFKYFLEVLSRKYFSLSDIQEKSKFRNQFGCCFVNIERWLQHIVKVPKSTEHTLHVYRAVGEIFETVPFLIYVKSKPDNTLKCLIDLMLLPAQIWNPKYKLHPFVSNAVSQTLSYFIRGLVKLDPKNDTCISRLIKELITVYVPRLTVVRGVSQPFSTNSQFSLLRCLEDGENCSTEVSTRRIVIEALCEAFFKQNTKTPDPNSLKALAFISDALHYHQHHSEIVKYVISAVTGKVCCVAMYCEENNPCKKQANDLLFQILDTHLLRTDTELGNNVMSIFGKLCSEHLAFKACLIFDLFENITKVAPDLVARFLPQLLEEVKRVELKRGGGYDRALRKSVERIENSLKSIRSHT